MIITQQSTKRKIKARKNLEFVKIDEVLSKELLWTAPVLVQEGRLHKERKCDMMQKKKSSRKGSRKQ